jgi:hypothetical protein
MRSCIHLPGRFHIDLSSLSVIRHLPRGRLFRKFLHREAGHIELLVKLQTPIHKESNLPGFRQAITDTIQALGTGIWKARDGQVIGRIASRHQLRDTALSNQIQTVEMGLARLRAKFDEFLKTGAIRPCGCNQPTCPVYIMSPNGAYDMDQLRGDVLRQFRNAYPAFDGRSAW